MKIQYASDLHQEFDKNRRYLKKKPLVVEGEILLLAGDITNFVLLDKPIEFIDWASDNYEAVYWLPGNHEWYSYDMSKKETVLNEKIKDNVFLVNNVSIMHKDVNLIFSTLWGRIGPLYEWQIGQGLSDFRLIKMGKKKFCTQDFNRLHNESVAFLDNAIKQNTGKSIIVTHHVPTCKNYPAMFKGSSLNEAFAVEMHDFIEDSKANYWIYGHHHFNSMEMHIGKTKLITNQLGYIDKGEEENFRHNAIIEL
jgi:predicted phosphohydrolase